MQSLQGNNLAATACLHRVPEVNEGALEALARIFFGKSDFNQKLGASIVLVGADGHVAAIWPIPFRIGRASGPGETYEQRWVIFCVRRGLSILN